MKYKFKPSDKSEKEIEIERSLWTGKTKVCVDGNEVRKQRGNNFYEINMEDATRKMRVKGAGIDGIPRVYLDNQEILLARRLLWYEYVIACLPLILVFIGGAIGGVVGALAAVYNTRILRSNIKPVLKGLSILGVIVAAVVLYSILATLFLTLING